MSEWETKSGLATDFVGTIVSAMFERDNRDANKINAVFEIQPEDSEKTLYVRMGIGSGWESLDGGESVESKVNKGFHRNCTYGKVIDRAVEIVGADKIEEVIGKSPRFIKGWEGTTWYWVAEDESFTGADGKKVQFDRLYPTQFEGKGPVQGLTKKAPTASVDPEVEAKLRSLAANTADHQAFLNAAVRMVEVVSDDELLSLVGNESYYLQLKDS